MTYELIFGQAVFWCDSLIFWNLFPKISKFRIFSENCKFRSTDDGDQPENGMSEPAEDFSTFKKAVNESICHQKDQSNVDRNEMTST